MWILPSKTCFFLPVGGANSVPPIHLDGPKCCWILSSKCDIKLQGKHISGWWFGTWLDYDFPNRECHHPNWRTHFFRKVETTNQEMYKYYLTCINIIYHTYIIYIYFRRNKVYASWQLDKASISVNRGSHFQVHFVWQVWDGQLSPAFKSIRLKAFGGWKFDRGTTKLHAKLLEGGNSTGVRQSSMLGFWRVEIRPGYDKAPC